MPQDPKIRSISDDAVERGIADYLQFHDRYVAPRLPAAPAEWKDLSADFARIAAESATPKRGGRRFWGAAGLSVVAAAAGLTYLIEVRRDAAPARVMDPPSRKIESSAPPTPAPRPVIVRTPEAPRDRNVEVHILAALHRVGADLGDPIEVQFVDRHWKVLAIESNPARVETLRQAIGALGGVELVLNPARLVIEGLSEPPAATRDAKSPAAVLIFASQLERYFGSRAELNSAADRALDRSQAILARAHALERLDREFPSSIEKDLGAPEIESLRTIRADHHRAAASMRRGLETDFALLAAALGLENPSASEARPALLTAAARWDHTLAIVLGGAATSLTPDQLKAELSAAYAGVHRSLGDLP